MIKILLLVFVVGVCYGQNLPVAPPHPPVLCGNIPANIHSCLGNPKIVDPQVASQCPSSISECARMKCVFKKSGWLKKDGVQVDKQKVIAHLDQYAKEKQEWNAAIQHVKTTCLQLDLPAQGVYLNCLPYDIVHCVITGFFRKASPSQWSTHKDCSNARQYAAACAVCPEDCFATAIPIGSCNACRLLPTTP